MSLHAIANHMASKGRGPDTMLIHMAPSEVQGLQALAMKHGGSLTINPDTGLPEAGFLDKLLPAIIGFAVTAATGIPAWQVGLGVGAVETARTGDLGKGIQAGLGAYGGAGLGAGMTTAGGEALANQAAGQSYLASAPGVLEGAGAGLSADMAANLTNAGVTDTIAANAAQQAAGERLASASMFDKLSAGFDAAKANPSSLLTKDNFKYMSAAAAPILADQAVRSNMPTTTTRPGAVRTFSYNPYEQLYTPTGNYEVPVKAAEGGLMGMNNGGYAPGQLDFMQRSEPVVRMAGGGVPGYAAGALVSDQQIFDYFKNPTPGRTDAQIAADMQTFNVSAADIARATGTQGQQSDYEKRFVQALNPATLNSADFMAKTADVGLKDQALVNAMQNSGMSAAAQYAATHSLNDAAGIASAPKAAQDFYNAYGYKTGDAPGDQGGIAGLYANIDYAADRLQDRINSGELTVAEAQNLSSAEMARLGISQADVKAATGSDFGNLFTAKKADDKITGGNTTGGNTTGGNTTGDKVVDKTCGTGYHWDEATQSCVKDTVADTKTCPTGYHYDPATKSCVQNVAATQNTTSNVDTSTDIATADSTALAVGVGGGGNTVVNPNGTITTRPDIPGIPAGGFTGMESLRNAYTAGGGSLGYVPYAPKTMEEFESKYNTLTGGSKSAYDYLTGKTKYSATPYTETGEIMKPYAESVLGVPRNLSSKKVLFDPVTKTYKNNPDYIPVSYTDKGEKVYGLSSRDIAAQLPAMDAKSDYEKWMSENNVTLAQIAQALGISLAEAKKRYGATTKAAAAPVDTTQTDATPAKEGGLMAMARGGMAQRFNLGDYSDGGRLLRGPGDGVSDSIPATIGNKRPARLADGEFVVPARIVSELGNGSTEAGARKLYAMMDRVQRARRGTVGKGKVAKNSRSDKYLPA